MGFDEAADFDDGGQQHNRVVKRQLMTMRKP